jgi:hypothetical protein
MVQGWKGWCRGAESQCSRGEVTRVGAASYRCGVASGVRHRGANGGRSGAVGGSNGGLGRDARA